MDKGSIENWAWLVEKGCGWLKRGCNWLKRSVAR